MDVRSGFECHALRFDRDCALTVDSELDALLARLAKGDVTDLIVLSHGWRNDERDAAKLYADILKCHRDELDRPAATAARDPLPAGRTFAVAEVYWPSKKSADPENIPGGAASLPAAGGDVAAVRALIDDFATLYGPAAGPALDEMRSLAPKLETDAGARSRFVDLVRSLTPPASGDTLDQTGAFHALDPKTFWNNIERPADDPGAGAGGATVLPGGGGAAAGGGAAGLDDFLGGIVHQVKDTLDIATFYTMKDRAGQVGVRGLNPALRKVRAQSPAVRVHLGGHSFGGRLVTATLLGAAGDPPLTVHTLALLQAAYSHFGLSENYTGSTPPTPGYFAAVRARGQVSGPTIVTHSKNDKAVGMAYPIAARLAGQQASDIGDASSLFGGMGRNGAQRTARTNPWKLAPTNETYDFVAGDLYNLCGDGVPGQPGVIAEHGDVAKPEIAHAWVAAIAKT